MNTGIQDAHNLAWKLAAVVQGVLHRLSIHPLICTCRQDCSLVAGAAVWGATTNSLHLFDQQHSIFCHRPATCTPGAIGRASAGLLDTYESERLPVARANTALSVANFHESLSVPRALVRPDACRLRLNGLARMVVQALRSKTARIAAHPICLFAGPGPAGGGSPDISAHLPAGSGTALR